MKKEGYGVVYTPQNLAIFVAKILNEEAAFNGSYSILDPACGEGSLLRECHAVFSNARKKHNCIGIDIDRHAIHNNREVYDENIYRFIAGNTILPSRKQTAEEYWKDHIKDAINLIIANPPWSSDRIFPKEELTAAGYFSDTGQYDSYVLFIELSLKLLEKDGYMAFIIPDSLFSRENKQLRKFLIENTSIVTIARLGEKIFPDVNRATSVIVIKKSAPNTQTKTKCFRLTPHKRAAFLEGRLDLYKDYSSNAHTVLQKRFAENKDFVFDIDATEEDEHLLLKIERDHFDWASNLKFGRGVEISKSGSITICPECGNAQGYSKKHILDKTKKCAYCSAIIPVNEDTLQFLISQTIQEGFEPIYVGENIKRYTFDGVRYIKPNVKGINYKDPEIYKKPKLLVRKTGLGIYATIDYENTLVSQTVYSFNRTNNDIPLEYYLGILNSRVIYYYYLKKYGQNEWKSHPYLTKDIIFALPIKQISAGNNNLCLDIANKAKALMKRYDRILDIELEIMIMDLYDLNQTERRMIAEELSALPDLSAINSMKTSKEELHV